MAVPVEMHLDPAILVGPDLLALGPDHHRGLRAAHHRHRGRRQGAESLAGVDTVQLALELRAAPAITGLVEFLDYPVLGANHQVFAVLVQARVVAQVEQMARPDTPGASPQANSLVLGLDRLDAGPCIVFAVLALHILARVVVERVVGRGMGAPDIGAHFQAGAGTLEVVVVEAQRAGLDLARHVPVEEVVALAMAEARRVIGHAGVAGRAVVRAVGIGEHQDVALLFVAEPVVNAFLLHQPADEIEAGLAVLHTVFPLAVGAREGILEIGETKVAEHLLDDVRDLLVLEDAAVGGARQQPQPGPQGDLVAGELAGAGALATARDDAVEIPPAAAGEFQREAHRLAQQGIQRQGGIARDQFELVAEQPAQLFATLQPLQLQDLGSQRGVHVYQAGVLGEQHGESSLIVTCGGRPEQRASSAPDDRTTQCRRERLANSHDTPARLLRTRRP